MQIRTPPSKHGMGTPKHLERKRLGKCDQALIERALKDEGLDVYCKEDDRVEAFDESGRYLCGFYWCVAKDGVPGAWRFDLPLAHVHCPKDLGTAVREVRRVQKYHRLATDAWKAFSKSKSQTRWSDYRGWVAALFRPGI